MKRKEDVRTSKFNSSTNSTYKPSGTPIPNTQYPIPIQSESYSLIFLFFNFNCLYSLPFLSTIKSSQSNYIYIYISTSRDT